MLFYQWYKIYSQAEIVILNNSDGEIENGKSLLLGDGRYVTNLTQIGYGIRALNLSYIN